MTTTLYVYSFNPIPERSSVGGNLWSVHYDEIHKMYIDALNDMYRDDHVHRLLRVEAPVEPVSDINDESEVEKWVKAHDEEILEWIDLNTDGIEIFWPALDQFVPLDVPAEYIPTGGIDPSL